MQKIAYVAIFLALFLFGFIVILNIETEDVILNDIQNTSVQDVVTKADIESEIISKEVEKDQIVESTSEEVIKSNKKDSSSYVSEAQPVPSNVGKFKSYTNYQILSKDSKQWTKIQCNENAYTDENGLRKVDEYYCVAMGSYYAKNLGDLFEIQTEGGLFKVIICDFKADEHTDANNQYTLANGCMVEFYVDINILNDTAEQMGDISYIDQNFSGEIVSINKVGNYFQK